MANIIRFSTILSCILLITLSPLNVYAQNVGIWFCNFYPNQAPISVHPSVFGGDSLYYVVSYPDCKYLANFGAPGAPIQLTARTASPSQPNGLASQTYPALGAGDTFARTVTIVTRPDVTGGFPAQPFGLLRGGPGNPDGDNNNIIIARPFNNDPGVSMFTLESMVTPFIVRNPMIGAFVINELNQQLGRVRNIVINSIPPVGFPFNVPDNRNAVNGIVPYFLGNLDCFNVGPPGYGSLGPYNDVHFTVYKGAHVTDRPFVSFNNPPDAFSQWVQCFVADSIDNSGTLIGQPFLITGTHPLNSITLTALHGYGSAQFPFSTAQFTFSGSTRQAAQAQVTGLVNIQVTPVQATVINAMLVAGQFNAAFKLSTILAYIVPLLCAVFIHVANH